jgi:ABC-type sugar transport system substrate-binding protein
MADAIQKQRGKSDMKTDWHKRLFAGLAPAVTLAALLAPGSAIAEDHYKVFLDMSYSGNTWQAAAANGIKALASTPPYDKSVEFKTVISGTDVQHQISDLQSMVASGANAIILYPLSPTALNRVIKQACAKGVVVFAYDSTVTEPCAHNVSNITAHYGANTAQWMVNQMGGKGEVIFNHGVAGTTVTKTYDEQAYGVFRKYPGIKISAISMAIGTTRPRRRKLPRFWRRIPTSTASGPSTGPMAPSKPSSTSGPIGWSLSPANPTTAIASQSPTRPCRPRG